MERLDRGAHRRHHQTANRSNQRREYHQAGFVGANECPQPARRLEVTGLGDHFAVSVCGQNVPPASFSGVNAASAIWPRTGVGADKAANASSQSRHAACSMSTHAASQLYGGQERYLNAHVSQGGWPVLVLNADFRPLSYYPLSLWSWQDAIKAVFLDRVNIVEHYDRAVRSPSFEIQLPSVVSLKSFVKPTTHPAFTRFNVFLRDRFACQYCSADDDLTFDHIIPRSKGGQTTWENVVAACSPCN